MWRHNPQTARPARAARRRRDRRRAARARELLVRARRRRRRAPGPGARRRRADGRRLLLRQRRAARRRRRAAERRRPRSSPGRPGVDTAADRAAALRRRRAGDDRLRLRRRRRASELEIAGAEGASCSPTRGTAVAPRIVLERGSSASSSKIKPADSYRLELEDMAAAIRGERAPLLGRDDAFGQARAIDALYRSAAEGRAVTLA